MRLLSYPKIHSELGECTKRLNLPIELLLRSPRDWTFATLSNLALVDQTEPQRPDAPKPFSRCIRCFPVNDL
jgi:hypothetical protein